MIAEIPIPRRRRLTFFFFNDTATTEIYTLSLHDALPILPPACVPRPAHWFSRSLAAQTRSRRRVPISARSEEHTSELQSQSNLVCRLLLEKKKKGIFRWLMSLSQAPAPPILFRPPLVERT